MKHKAIVKYLPMRNYNEISYDSSNLMSANEVLCVLKPQIGVSVKTSLVDLRRYHNIYLSSPTLSNYSTLGPRGENNIIKQVPATSDYGAMIVDSVVASHDWVGLMFLKHY